MIRIFLPLLLLLLAASPAHAWVPPTETIVEKWAAAYEGTDHAVIEGTWRQGAVATPFRVDVQDGRIALRENGRPSTDATSVTVWNLMLRPRSTLEAWVKLGALDAAQTGLARRDGRIAWTVGAKGEKQAGPQIWIDRQWHTPMRAVLPPAPGRADVIEFLGYAQSETRIFPTEVRADFGGENRRVYTIEAVRFEKR